MLQNVNHVHLSVLHVCNLIETLLLMVHNKTAVVHDTTHCVM